jgi:periplasmic protein TonB
MSSAPTRRRFGRALAWVGAAVAHLVVLFGVSQVRPTPPQAPPPLIQVELVPPIVPPPPPPPPAPPTVRSGGGSPSAPSVVRPTPEPLRPPEVPAPPRPAPEQPLVTGAAPTPAPTPGFGQGVEGTGTGTGSGSGDGPGVGEAGPRFISGPTVAQLRAAHPPEELRRGRSGRAAINCRIGLDQRLEACRLVSESPAGRGYGAAALQVDRFFRFAPPTFGGRPQSGERVTVTVDFGRPR